MGEHRVIVLDSGLRNTAVQGAWGVVRRGVVFRNAEGVAPARAMGTGRSCLPCSDLPRVELLQRLGYSMGAGCWSGEASRLQTLELGRNRLKKLPRPSGAATPWRS